MSPVKTEKLSTMRLFKKPSPKGDDKESDSSSLKPASNVNFFNWFTKFTKPKPKVVEAATDESRHKETQTLAINEIEIVPKTEITASRQVLNNIELVLQGESSGAKSGKTEKTDTSVKQVCKNKFCCGIVSRSQSHLESADDGDDDDSVKTYSPNKDNRETTSRRTSSSDDDNKKFYIFHPPAVDYSKLEVPDSSFPSIIDSLSLPTINQNDMYELTKEIKQPNYQVLSSIEHNLDPSKYNILKCHTFNAKYRQIYNPLGSGCRPDWKIQDYNDDKKSTRMSFDTRAIKEFHRLNEISDILLHFHDVMVEETTKSIESYKEGIMDRLSWLMFRGKEIKEKEHETKDTFTWIRNVSSKILKVGSSEY